MRRWSEKKHKYEPYAMPDKWNVSVYESDMDKKINCARCGKIITFGEGYTSRQIHDAVGFGYAICRSCDEAEWAEYKKYKDKGWENSND